MTTDEQAQKKEAEVRASFPGLRVRERGDESPTPNEDGQAIYRALCRVGDFWKDGHGHVYFSRDADGEDYRVGSDSKWRFPQFVGELLDLPIRAARICDALDHLTERMRAQAPVGMRVLCDEAAITKTLETLAATMAEQVSYKPLKLTKAAKKKRLGGSDKRAKRVRR